MKKSSLVFVILIISAISTYGQFRVSPNRPYVLLSSQPGYITINELSFGFGLSDKAVPFSDFYYGVTSVHGYQLDESFALGGGIGLSKYGDGVLIPLFVDLRYRFNISTLTFYLFGDGGFMLDPSDFNGGTMLFVNAGPGVRMALSPQFAVNLSPAILIQMGPSNRSSFLNIKLGATYKPKN